MPKYKIAITGGIGSGKSTVSNILKEQGFPVFSCDNINRNLLNDNLYISKIKQIFPMAVVEGKIDKQILSTIVFSNKEELEKLNKLSHPIIMKKLWKEMQSVKEDLAFAEVQLLFEEKLENYFDCVWVVKRNLENRIQSVIQRDHSDRISVLSRINKQIDYDSYFSQINFEPKIYFLFNNGNIEDLKKEIEFLLRSCQNDFQ